MSCEGLTGQKLKDCQVKAKTNKAKETDKVNTDAKKKNLTETLKKAVSDLSTFKNKDVVKWEKKKNGERKTTGASTLSFGGTGLGKGKTRLARKKGGKSTRSRLA